jgi:hypothetical protein
MDVITEKFGKNFPAGVVRRIAVKAITEDKLADSEWLENEIDLFKKKDSIAKRMTPEFSLFTYTTALKFLDLHGMDSFDIMKELLKDPAKVHPGWGATFIGTVRDIGLNEIRQKEDIYTAVTTHPAWKGNIKHRYKFISYRQAKSKDKESS